MIDDFKACDMNAHIRIPMKHFATIRARAAKRKGGDAELNALLPKVKSAQRWPNEGRSVLSDMTKRIFSAGFAWSVIEKSGQALRLRSSASSRNACLRSPMSSGSAW